MNVLSVKKHFHMYWTLHIDDQLLWAHWAVSDIFDAEYSLTYSCIYADRNSMNSASRWYRLTWKSLTRIPTSDSIHEWQSSYLHSTVNVLIKFHQNNQKVIYFWRFDLYQRPSSEEADNRSSYGSWRDKLE